MKKSSSSGSILFESIIALLVLAPFVAASIALISQLSKASMVASSRQGNIHRYLQVRNRLKLELATLDSFKFEIDPVVHRNGDIRYVDGAVVEIAPNREPERESDAITFMSLQSEEMIPVESQENDVIQGCRVGSPINGDSLEHFLLGTADGFHEAIGKNYIKWNPGGRSCAKIQYVITNSILITNRIPDGLVKALILIPIRTIHTLYVDKNSTLRLLSHKGGIITENQPLVEGINKLSLNSFRLNSLNITGLGVLLEIGGAKFDFVLTNLVGREGYLNLLMNPL